MNKTVFERVRAELTNAEGKVYQVELDLEINQVYVGDGAVLAKRILIHHPLAPRFGDKVPDGEYTLTFMFDGTSKNPKVRKSGQTLLHRQ
jgi:hypothetical protein